MNKRKKSESRYFLFLTFFGTAHKENQRTSRPNKRKWKRKVKSGFPRIPDLKFTPSTFLYINCGWWRNCGSVIRDIFFSIYFIDGQFYVFVTDWPINKKIKENIKRVRGRSRLAKAAVTYSSYNLIYIFIVIYLYLYSFKFIYYYYL